MIKIKEFTELTEKDKASIRELIDDCIRYEQLELAVPDLDEEDGTAYLYYQSSKIQSSSVYFFAMILRIISRLAPSQVLLIAARVLSQVCSRSLWKDTRKLQYASIQMETAMMR